MDRQLVVTIWLRNLFVKVFRWVLVVVATMQIMMLMTMMTMTRYTS